jgi:hypothetical protein
VCRSAPMFDFVFLAGNQSRFWFGAAKGFFFTKPNIPS